MALFLFTAGCALFIQPAKALSVPVLSSRGYLWPYDNWYYIFGEVQNLETIPIEMQYITTRYYDSGNNEIAMLNWYPFMYHDVVFPNQKSPFFIILDNSTISPKIDHYSLELTSRYVSATPLPLNIISSNSSVDSSGWMHVTGQVQNAGQDTANNTVIFLTCYDSNGKVVYTWDTSLSSQTLTPGQISNFSVPAVFPDLTPLVANYSLFAQAQMTVTPIPSPTPTPSPTATPTPTPTPTPTQAAITPPPNPPPPTATITPTPKPTPTASPSPTPTTTETPTPSPPTPTPNQSNTPAAYTYTAYAPAHSNAIAATAVTAVTVGVVSLAVSAVTNPLGQAGRATQKMADILPEGIKKWLEEFVSSKRKPTANPKTGSPYKPTKPEAAAYVVSLVALTIAFSYVKVPSITLILEVLPTVLATAVIVELVKTYATEVFARTHGLWAEHRIWYFGLAMFLITTFSFGIPFSSPSRNIYHSPKLTKRLNGMVATVSVLVTLAFAALFFGLIVGGFTLIGGTGLAMCIIMGFIDTFPVEPLNGKAIFDHSKALWAAIFVVTLAIYASWLIFI